MRPSAPPIAAMLTLALLAGCSAGEESSRQPSAPAVSAAQTDAGVATNLATLNSAFDDFAAALLPGYDNADTAAQAGCSGITFTSNRPRDAASLPLDEESRYGEMVYASTGSALSWGVPELLAGGTPNWGATVPGGVHLAALFAAAYRPGSRGGTDVLGGIVTGDSLNSPWWDSHPALSPSGELLVFASDRPNERPNTEVRGRLQTDLYLSRKRAGGGWGAPVRLPAPVNSAASERSPHFGADGWFYFASDREGSEGFDIYRCLLAPDGRVADGAAGEPRRLPEPINSAGDDLFPWMGCDGCALYLSSNRAGGQGGYDLWAVTRFRMVAVDGRVALRRPDGSLEPAAELPIEIAPDGGGAPITLRTDAAGRYRAVIPACAACTLRTAAPSCFAAAEPLRIGPVATMAWDTAVTAPDLVYERVAGPAIDTYSDHVPYFVTGYWYPNTSDRHEELLRRLDRGELRQAAYIDDNDFPYADSSGVIDAKLREIERAIDGYLRLMFDTCALRRDPLVITVVGYVDTLGLSWGVYPDSTVRTTDVTVDGQTLKGITVERGSVMQRQEGNEKLSHLRAWYTYREIDRAMQASPRYTALQREGRIVWKWCGGYTPRKAQGRYRADPDSRKFEIFIR